MKKDCIRHIKKNLEQKKQSKEQEIKYVSNEKTTKIFLIVGLTKKALYNMSQYFSKPYEPIGGDINVKVHLYNYAIKTDFKRAIGINASKFAAKSET